MLLQLLDFQDFFFVLLFWNFLLILTICEGLHLVGLVSGLAPVVDSEPVLEFVYGTPLDAGGIPEGIKPE